MQIMLKYILLSGLMALPLLCGCAGLQRPLSDAALGAGGAYAGYELSNGNPIATAGGAAAGVLLSEGFQAWKSRSEKNAYSDGYTRGSGDSVKTLYWHLQDQQRTKADRESYRLFEVVIPEHWENEILLEPTRRTIRIQE